MWTFKRSNNNRILAVNDMTRCRVVRKNASADWQIEFVRGNREIAATLTLDDPELQKILPRSGHVGRPELAEDVGTYSIRLPQDTLDGLRKIGPERVRSALTELVKEILE